MRAMRPKTFLMFVVISSIVLLSFASQVTAQEESDTLPEWIKYSVEAWVDNNISDEEFLALIENILNENISPKETETQVKLKNTEKRIVTGEMPELGRQHDYKPVPNWVKNRAQWWIDDKITDAQFLKTLHYLQKSGHLEYNHEKDIFSNEETVQSNLEKFLLNENKVLKITKETKWRILATEYGFEEREGITDSVKIIFMDITRVYEPIFYKFKVPSMTMQIFEFDNKKDLEIYWNTFERQDGQAVLESSRLTGNPNDNSECFFDHAARGAVTFCIYDLFVIQVIIFDQYNEHYSYNLTSENFVLDDTEPTTIFTNEILKKISSFKSHDIDDLWQILQKDTIKNNKIDSEQDESRTASVDTEPEKSTVYGIEKFSCVRDDFGLVTVSGQYNNNDTKKAQVGLDILFLDDKGNTVGKTSVQFYDLKEYESKRFLGHAKWDKNFQTCQMRMQ